MANDRSQNVEPLSMLPRFDSKATLGRAELQRLSQSSSIDRYDSFSIDDFDANTIRHRNLVAEFIVRTQSYPQLANSLLPRYHSDVRDENQSADTTLRSSPQMQVTLAEFEDKKARPMRTTSTFDIKYLERAYDRSGKKCWPAVNTNIGNFDLEYTYEIIGNMLESYIRYRKLNRCTALSSFVEYRNKIYKREKIAQYASSFDKARVKETRTKQTMLQNSIKPDETPSTMTQIDPSFTLIPSSPSATYTNVSPLPIPSSSSVTIQSREKPPTLKVKKSPVSADSASQHTPASKSIKLLPNETGAPRNLPTKSKAASLPHTKSKPTDKGLSRQNSSKSKPKNHSKNRNQTVQSSSIMSITKSSTNITKTKHPCIICTLL